MQMNALAESFRTMKSRVIWCCSLIFLPVTLWNISFHGWTYAIISTVLQDLLVLSNLFY